MLRIDGRAAFAALAGHIPAVPIGLVTLEVINHLAAIVGIVDDPL